jgi:hypothetical protein
MTVASSGLTGLSVVFIRPAILIVKDIREVKIITVESFEVVEKWRA